MTHVLTAVFTDTGFNSDPRKIAGVDNLQTIIGYTAWVATGVCIIALIVVGAVMAVQYDQGRVGGGGKLGAVVAGCVLIGAASPIAASVLGFNLFSSDPKAVPHLDQVQTIIGNTAWAAAAVCVIGVIWAGVRMAMNHREGQVDHQHLGQVFAGCAIVGSAATLVGAFI